MKSTNVNLNEATSVAQKKQIAVYLLAGNSITQMDALRMAIARLAEGRASIYTLNREEPVGGLEIEEVLNVWQKFRHDHNVRSI